MHAYLYVRPQNVVPLLGSRLPYEILSPYSHVKGSCTPPTLVVSNESDGMQGTKAKRLLA